MVVLISPDSFDALDVRNFERSFEAPLFFRWFELVADEAEDVVVVVLTPEPICSGN